MSESPAWPERIGFLILLKDRLAQCEDGAPYGWRAPHVGASEEQLNDAESALFGPLDPDHRVLLSHVNGWPEFFVTLELLSTEQLMDGNLRDQVFEASNLGATKYNKDAWIPLARATDDRDTMLVRRPGTSDEGRVVWLAGEIVEEYPSVSDWFAGMIQQHENALSDYGVERFR